MIGLLKNIIPNDVMIYSEEEVSVANHMPLSQARLCVNCETIHASKICPRCESKQFLSINNIVKSLK